METLYIALGSETVDLVSEQMNDDGTFKDEFNVDDLDTINIVVQSYTKDTPIKQIVDDCVGWLEYSEITKEQYDSLIRFQ